MPLTEMRMAKRAIENNTKKKNWMNNAAERTQRQQNKENKIRNIHRKKT